MSSALVLHSGGLDSSVLLGKAVAKHGAHNVVSLGVDYGQRHLKELEFAQKLCDHYGVRRDTIKIPPIENSALTNPNADIPKVDYGDIKGLSPAYVPFRNGLMLSLIASKAQGEGFETIYYGAHAEDAANFAYPDCTPEFNGAMANAIYMGTDRKVRLETPLQWMAKHEIVTLGAKLGVPFELTWSCYLGEEKHCGVCPTCRARKAAFQIARVEDPTAYAE